MSYRENSFPLSKGKVNLTTGTFGGGAFLCTVAGDLTITWDDDTTSVVSCLEGNAFNIVSSKSVEITSGTYQVA